MKKNQKDSDDFDIEKLTLKVKFWHFLTSPHYTNSQNSMVSFDSDDSQMTHRLLQFIDAISIVKEKRLFTIIGKGIFCSFIPSIVANLKYSDASS
jgi:hypothetical protein